MRLFRLGFFLLVFMFVLAFGVSSVEAASSSFVGDLAEPLGPICPLRLLLRQPVRCRDQGARAELALNAAQGLYPQHPLPFTQIDPHWAV